MFLREGEIGRRFDHANIVRTYEGGDYRGGTIGASPAYSYTAHSADVSVDERPPCGASLNLYANDTMRRCVAWSPTAETAHNSVRKLAA